MNENEYASEQQKHTNATDGIMDGARIISYNFSEGERLGGMKVRAEIRVVTGKQAEAIRELLLWVRQQRSQHREA